MQRVVFVSKTRFDSDGNRVDYLIVFEYLIDVLVQFRHGESEAIVKCEPVEKSMEC